MLYWDHRQFREFAQMTLLVRTASDPAAVIGGVRSIVRAMDPLLPLYNVQTMKQLYGEALSRPRFATISLGLFAALGLLLAAIGIYGVIAFITQQRSREIGIRLALGADRATVLRMVVAQGARLIALSLLIGSVAAFVLTRLLRALVFDISTTDPLTCVSVAAVIGFIGLLASWLPARRASGIDPVDAIRSEG
jgi:ABC-type antimicrobial peptide transport system permease subunit